MTWTSARAICCATSVFRWSRIQHLTPATNATSSSPASPKTRALNTSRRCDRCNWQGGHGITFCSFAFRLNVARASLGECLNALAGVSTGAQGTPEITGGLIGDRASIIGSEIGGEKFSSLVSHSIGEITGQDVSARLMC
eukprot:8669293-Pyramimonas_sp.AAC.1